MKAFFRGIGLAMILGVGVVTAGVSTAGGQLFFMENPMVGENAPDFTLLTTKGKRQTFHAWREGKPAIIFFWATWCPHCRRQLSELSREKNEFEDQGIRIAPVDLGESVGKVKMYLARNKIDLETFLDTDSVVAEMYAIIGVPTLYFVASDGTIRAVEHALPGNYRHILFNDS